MQSIHPTRISTKNCKKNMQNALIKCLLVLEKYTMPRKIVSFSESKVKNSILSLGTRVPGGSNGRPVPRNVKKGFCVFKILITIYRTFGHSMGLLVSSTKWYYLQIGAHQRMAPQKSRDFCSQHATPLGNPHIRSF